MASEEHQEQPAANQPSSNQEDKESLEPQEAIEQPDKTTIHSEDIIESDRTEPSQTTDSLAEEDIQAQQSPEIESSSAIQPEEEKNEASSSVTPSPPVIADREEEETESTPSKPTAEIVADSQTEEETEQVSVSENKNWWDVILDKIRSILPESVNNSLSDWVLTGIISSLIVVVLSTLVILLPPRSSNPVSQKSAETTATNPSPSSEVVTIPEQEVEIAIDSTKTEKTETSSSEVVSTPTKESETPLKSTESESQLLPEIETPETLVAPKISENLTVKTVTPPKPILTPEQSLIVSIQEKINEITNQYSDELIVSGEADLLSSRLRLKVSDEWYQLSRSRQDEFANETLKRSQKFNFNKLEIKDLNDNLIARSPVVGNKMVILQRTR